jgi:hypothetical protein
VLISPPDAVHGINHDYHAAFKKSAAGVRSEYPAAYCSTTTPAWAVPVQAGRSGPSVRPVAVIGIPLHNRIETWRQNLWPD